MKLGLIIILIFFASLAYAQPELTPEQKHELTFKTDALRKDVATLCEQSNYKDAITILNRIIELTPENPELYFDLANIYFFLQRYDEALVNYKKADSQGLNLSLRDTCYFKSALCYIYLGNEYEAINYLQQCLEVNPHHLEARQYLGRLKEAHLQTQANPEEPDIEPPAERYPVHWTEYINIKDRQEIEGLLDKPVELRKSCVDCVLTLAAKDAQPVKIKNCKQYWEFKNQGFSAQTPYDIALDNWFKFGCQSAYYHDIPIASKVSYLEDLDLSKRPLERLPLTLRLLHHPEEKDKITIAIYQYKNWIDYIPQMKARAENKYSIVLTDNASETINIKVLVWGDFDHDGYEDILLEVSRLEKASQEPDTEYAIITRLEKDGGLLQIEE